MNLQDLITGLNNGTITVLGNHYTNPLVKKIESYLNVYTKIVEKYKPLVGKPVKKGEANPESMLDLAKYRYELRIGYNMDAEMYCFDCGSTMYIIPVSETEIAYVDMSTYWKLIDESGMKYDFVFKKEHIEECSCCKIRDDKKLVSEIEVPTGELVFVNFFNSEKLNQDKEKEYEEPSINSILGRYNIMQQLSQKNVGYAQMGNTSICIFTNESDEIIITDCIFSYYKPTKKKQFLKEFAYGDNEKNVKNLVDYIDNGGFKLKGSISLSMWRWMCADKSVVKKAKEKTDEDSDIVNLKVNSGKWRIEHYYDFSKRGDVLFSKLNLVK